MKHSHSQTRLHYTSRFTGLLCLGGALLLLAGCNDWKLEERKSEMGDEVRHVIFRESKTKLRFPGSVVAKAFDYRPELILSYSSDSLSVKILSREHYRCESYSNGCSMMVRARFDDEPAIPLQAFRDRNAEARILLAGANDLAAAMLKHKTLKVEYPIGRGPVVAEFELGGLQSRIMELCNKASCKSGTDLGGVLATVGITIRE